jgi:type IV secretion system protein VirB4
MMTSAKKSKAAFLLETDCASHIPYARFVDAETIETKNGNLLQVIKINGLLAETMDDEWIDIEKRIRNSLLISLTDSTTAFYYHTIRRKIAASQAGQYENEFLQTLHNKWQRKLASQDFYINEHYLTIVKKPPVGKVRRLSDVFKNLSGKFDHAERERFRSETLKELGKISKQILTQFANYGATKLANKLCDEKRGIISDSLSFIYYLLNLESRELVAPEADVSDILSARRLFFDNTGGTLAFRGVDNSARYAGILAIKNYSHTTYTGMLDKLLDMKSELVICHSFHPIEKDAIRNKVKEVKRNQEQSDDGQTTASDKISDVLNEMGSQEVTLGYHQLSILCQADTQVSLDQKIADMDAVLNQIGIIAVREDMGLRPAFFAMLPANFAYMTRKALVSSKNMAGLVSLHNSSSGTPTGNFWGDAITILETISGSPYYFNFHVMDVANTFMIGPMGSGKTLLESFLLAESMRFGGKLVVFDKDRGMEIFIRALGGQYSLLRMGQRTGFAPFQLEDTPENRYFLFKLLRKIALQSGVAIDSDIEQNIHFAINGAFNLPKSERTFRNIVPFLGMRKAGSLRTAFDNWVNDGSYAWIFDNEAESLSLNRDVLGFDMTSVLDDTLVASVIYEYLFNRIESMMDGSRMRIVVAEGWRALQDESFKEKIRDWSSTPRKKNAFLIMDTQSPSDIAQSELACKIIQETVTQIYFANPTAEYNDYVGQFKLSEKEYQIIKSLNKSTRFFLLKHGKDSVVVRADLREGFDNEIAILSGRESNVRKLDTIRAKKGDDPVNWMADFITEINCSGIIV